MRIKRKAYISLEVVFLLTIMVISGMYVTVKLFNKGHNVSDQEAEAFSKVNHTVNNAINVGSTGGGGSGGGGGSTPSEPTGVSEMIYWGIDASGKLIISDVEVATAINDEHKGSFSGDTEFTEDENDNPTTPWYKYADSIYSIEVVRNNRKVAPASTAVWFEYLNKVSSINVTDLDTSNVTNMYSMFYGCGESVVSFTITGLDTWDTSNVIDMTCMFEDAGYNSTTFNIGNIGNWDTSNVTNMGAMFYNAGYSATTWVIGDISGWKTSNVTLMTWMFSYAGRNAITELDLSGWDASNVTDMNHMFYKIESLQTVKTPKNIPSAVIATKITSADLWDITDNNKKYTAGTFPVGNGNVSHTLSFTGPSISAVSEIIYWGVTDAGQLIISDEEVTEAQSSRRGSFAGTETFSSSSLPPWATHSNEIISIKVEKYNRRVAPTSTAYWFYDLQNVANADVSNLDTSNVADMKFTFYTVGYSASTVSISGLENWNTSNVTDMSYMFLSVGGNQASEIVISGMNNWDVSKVTNMRSMFDNVGYRLATTVDFGDISGWDTSNVTTMRDMFAYVGCLRNAAWTFGSLSNWDTSNVTDMYEMFYYNGGIGSTVLDMSNWDVSKVTNMSYMFYYCNIKTIITPASIQNGTTTSNITTKTFKGSDGKTYAAGTFPRGNTTSITLTAQ